MQILIHGLNYSPEPTGIALYTAGLAAGLAKRGHSVTVRTGFPHYPAWQFDRDSSDDYVVETLEGVRVERFRHRLRNPTSLVDRGRMELDFGARSCRKPFESPDVLLAVSPALLSSAMAVARARLSKHRPAIGVWVQDLYSAGITETKLGRQGPAALITAMERRVLRRADAVFAIHERMRTRIINGLGVAPNSIHVVRNWTNIAPADGLSKQDARRQLNWNRFKTIVLHAGNMGVKQDLGSLIDAARQSTDPDVHFILLGDGNQRDVLTRAANGLNNVTIVPPLPAVQFPLALAAADVLVVNEIPGMTDMAVPSKLTSYFASGRPVLAATDPKSVTAAELKSSGGGLCVPPRSPNAFNSAVAQLTNNLHRAADFSAAGQRFFRSTLSAERAITDFETTLTQLAETRKEYR